MQLKIESDLRKKYEFKNLLNEEKSKLISEKRLKEKLQQTKT